VFSVQVQEVINRAEAVRALAGHVARLEPVETKVLVDIDYERERERLAQGPGFPNLSCLGLLADRVLGAYARRARGAFAPAADAAAIPSRGGSPAQRR
jgi:hypothetical protein